MLSHKSLEDREASGAAFLEQWPAFAGLLHSWFVDDMGDEMTVRWGLWPERYILLRHGCVAWASSLSNEPVDLPSELRAAAATAFL